MAACLLFNFAAMSEFVVVRTISHIYKPRNEAHDKMQANNHNQNQEHRNEAKTPIPTILLNSGKLEPTILPYNEYYSGELSSKPVSALKY
jgi:hypothetical protein